MPPGVIVSYAHSDDITVKNDSGGFVSLCAEHVERKVAKILGSEADNFRDSASGRIIVSDRQGLRGFHLWSEKLAELFSEASIMLVFASAAYFHSVECFREWQIFSLATKQKIARHGRKYGESRVVVIDLMGNWLISKPEHCDESTWATWQQAIRMVHSVSGGHLHPVAEQLKSGTITSLPNWVTGILDRISADIAEQLLTQHDIASSPNNLRNRSQHFVERGGVNDAVANTLFGSAENVACLYGLTGLGKTEQAVVFAQEFAQNFPAGRWLVPATHHRDCKTLLAELPELQRHCRTEESACSSAEATLAELTARHHDVAEAESECSTLLILDDVTAAELYPSMQTVLKENPWLRVLMTSRQDGSGLSLQPSHTVKLGPMAEDQALRMLTSYSEPYPGALQGADDVVQLLGGHTLALQQAGVSIAADRGRVTFAQYAELLEREGLLWGDAQLALDPALAHTINHQDRLVANAVNRTLDDLEDSDLRVSEAARCAAMLPRDRVPWRTLQEAVSVQHQECQQAHVWNVIKRKLIRWQLITEPSPGSAFGEMHPIVQAVVAAHWR